MNRFHTDIDCMKSFVYLLNRKNFGVFQPQVGDIFKFDFQSGKEVRLAVRQRMWINTSDGIVCQIELFLTDACTSFIVKNIPDLEAYVRDENLSTRV